MGDVADPQAAAPSRPAEPQATSQEAPRTANVPQPPGVIPRLQGVVVDSADDGSPKEVFRVELRTGFTIELKRGETLHVTGAAKPVAISAGDVGFKSTAVTDVAGNGSIVSTMTCEDGSFARARAHLERRAKTGGDIATDERVRTLVRSVVNNCERFNGKAESMTGLNLAHYG